jgi:3-oxoacyl-(acyl-carrier-protein) synthase
MGALTTGSDPALAMRPFDRDRSGFAATGGAAVLILESSSSARRRHVTPLARLAGWGQAADGYHPAAPHPQGIGLADAINLALADAQSSPAEVDYINAHGTGTPAGDAAEALALSRIFNSSCPPISSTKALTGHGLSLAGAMEGVLCILALRHAIIPGQAHLSNPLPEGAHLNFPRLTTSHPIRSALNNSSGFGGANVVHLFTHA